MEVERGGQVDTCPMFILVGFGRAMRPCAPGARLFRHVNVQIAALRCVYEVHI
jgi:hypothetical protein